MKITGESVQAASQGSAARAVPAERSDSTASSSPDFNPCDVLLASADALESEALCLAESHTIEKDGKLDWQGDEDPQATYEHWLWLADRLRLIADSL
jgi:hypothetical protein